MALLVGAVMSSHAPAIGRAIARGRHDDAAWKPFFEAYAPVHAWLAEVQPDVAIVVYNDHGLNFFLDRMPTFAIGAAAQYRQGDEGLGLPLAAPFTGDEDLSWQLIESLVADEFDVTSCQEMAVDHAFALPMALLFPGAGRPIRTVPVCVNTVQFPLPTPERCWKLGEAIGRAVEAWPVDARVVLIGSGGLSHRIAGPHGGFTNRDFDLRFLESLVREPRWATRYSCAEIVERCGTQAAEILSWLAVRAALPHDARRVHWHYQGELGDTAAALTLFDGRPPD